MSSFEAKNKFSSDFSDYEFQTTSSDTFLPPEDILSQKGPVWHGTALGWHSSFSSHIVKLPIVSERFCGVKLDNSNLNIIAYTAYLPTAGQDDEFLEEISLLTHDLLQHANPNSTIIIGMDANCSEKSTHRRQKAFSTFTKEFMLKTTHLDKKPTFHHNNGSSESQIDHILTNKPQIVSFSSHLCKLDDPSNLSSHDAVLGKIKLPETIEETDHIDYSDSYEEFIPKKIIWSDNTEYQEMTVKILQNLLTTFDEPEHLPSLAEMTSNMLVMCAEKCFEWKESKHSHVKATPRFSKPLREAYKNHIQICKEWRKAGRPISNTHKAKSDKLESQRYIQKLQRDEESHKAKAQHEDLMDTYDKNISDVCKKLKQIRGDESKCNNISEIETFLGAYKGDNVLEGFRANTEYLCNEKSDKSDTDFSDEFLLRCMEDLIIINDISEDEPLKIPHITLENLQDIVFKKLKCNKACDVYKVTTEHLKYAGDEALTLLCTLINRVIDDLKYLSAPEFKASIASVIFKGKDKPRQNHKSYRLVRVCHQIGRIIDEHIRPMAVQLSKPLQSNNQYGFTEKITYLMGALQRHEAQKYCIDNKKTFFGCSLDGDSAFEVVCRTIQQRELYFAGESGQLSQYNSGCYKNTEKG